MCSNLPHKLAACKAAVQPAQAKLGATKSNGPPSLRHHRLVVLQAAHALDLRGNKEARGQIAAAKALAPSAVLAVIDRAIQVRLGSQGHGGACSALGRHANLVLCSTLAKATQKRSPSLLALPPPPTPAGARRGGRERCHAAGSHVGGRPHAAPG